MGKTIRMITKCANIVAMAIDSTDIVRQCEQYHQTSAVCTAALGRLLTATSMMGCQLKGKDDKITVRIDGDGPARTVLAASDSQGNVRGFIANGLVEIPLNGIGKLDVKGAVGTSGSVTVIKDLGLKEPYTGTTPLISGEIAEDITAYFAQSEQIPSVCALGVLVNPDLTVKYSGGFLIQLLPFAEASAIDKLEENVKKLPSVTQMMSDGMTVEEICKKALEGFEIEVLDTYNPEYRCNCSRERVENALMTLSTEDLLSLAEDNKDAEVNCQFCNKRYHFSKKELIEMDKKRNKK